MVYTVYGVRLPTVPLVGMLGCRGSRFLAHRRNAHFSFCLKNRSPSWKILAGKSLESGSQSSIATASENLLVPGTEIDDSSSREELEVPELSDDSQYKRLREAIDEYEGGLEKFSRGYEKFGFTRRSPLSVHMPVLGMMYYPASRNLVIMLFRSWQFKSIHIMPVLATM